jgi:hypothetical protein
MFDSENRLPNINAWKLGSRQNQILANRPMSLN